MDLGLTLSRLISTLRLCCNIGGIRLRDPRKVIRMPLSRKSRITLTSYFGNVYPTSCISAPPVIVCFIWRRPVTRVIRSSVVVATSRRLKQHVVVVFVVAIIVRIIDKCPLPCLLHWQHVLTPPVLVLLARLLRVS